MAAVRVHPEDGYGSVGIADPDEDQVAAVPGEMRVIVLEAAVDSRLREALDVGAVEQRRV